MSKMQEQLREAMAGVEMQPRRNLEGVPEVDTEKMVNFLSGKPEAAAEEVEDETDALQAEEADADAEPETEEGEREPVKLADLADLLEWTPEAVYQVQVPLGDGQSLSLGEVKDKLKESMSFMESREETEQELAARMAELETREARLNEELQHAAPAELIRAEAALQRAQDEYNRIDWVQLETGNPGQAALTRQKLTEQIRQAQQQRDGIRSNIEALQGDLQKQQQAAVQRQLQQAKLDLHRMVPTWANEATFNTEREQLISYGIKEGIDEATLRNIADPKIIAYLYRNWQRDKKLEAARPVEKPPKVLKPQAVKNRQAGRKANVDKLMATAKASHDMRDKQAAIAALLRSS